MKDSHFEAEIQALVSRVSHDLARDITGLILRRLGLDGAPPAPTARKPPAAAAHLAKPAKRGRKPKALAPAPKASSKKAAAAGKAGKRGGRGKKGSDKSAVLDQVEKAVLSSNGISVGQIQRSSNLSRAVLSAALKTLKEAGRIHMGGKKRFARYAATQAGADRASNDARGGK